MERTVPGDPLCTIDVPGSGRPGRVEATDPGAAPAGAGAPAAEAGGSGSFEGFDALVAAGPAGHGLRWFPGRVGAGGPRGVARRRRGRGSHGNRIVDRHATADGLIGQADNPAAKVTKPRLPPWTSSRLAPFRSRPRARLPAP